VKCVNCKEKDATLFCQNFCGDLCDRCSAIIHALGALQHHVVDKKPQPQHVLEYKDQPAVQCEADAENKALAQQPFEFDLHWHVNNKTSNIVLSLDANDLLRVSHDQSQLHGSAVCKLPLSSSQLQFDVRVDSASSFVFVGVCNTLPPQAYFLGSAANYGVGYCSSGHIFTNGSKIRCGAYAAGDVIRVEVNFRTKLVSFYKNGVKIGSFVMDFELSELRAAVSLSSPGDQVTLLKEQVTS